MQVLRSHTDYPDSVARAQTLTLGGFAGQAALAQVNYNTRTWRGQALGRLLDPGFRADAGFVEEVDVRELNIWGQRQFWGGPDRDFNLSHGYERLSNGGAPVITEHLPQLEAAVSWSRRLVLGATAQYRATDRNPAAFGQPVDVRRRHLFSRFILSYEVSPQTLFYLGYSNDRDAVTGLDRPLAPMRLTGRVFVAKLSYAWRP
jgi:hypothetical protein